MVLCFVNYRPIRNPFSCFTNLHFYFQPLMRGSACETQFLSFEQVDWVGREYCCARCMSGKLSYVLSNISQSSGPNTAAFMQLFDPALEIPIWHRLCTQCRLSLPSL